MGDETSVFCTLVLAGRSQFAPGERLVQPCVESRMLLWCDHGRGVVRIDGRRETLAPGRWLFLPWGRSMAYAADRADPFLVGGIHMIPAHAADRDVAFTVAHGPDDALAGRPWRRDAPLPGLEGIVAGEWSEAGGLRPLVTYVVRRALREGLRPAPARQMAALLVDELAAAREAAPAASGERSPRLTQVLRYAADRLDHPLALDELAGVAGVSPSTLVRMFRRELGTTPKQWLLRRRIEAAGRLLQTTRLPVGEVGRRVGIDDPYYFSRVFKRFEGMAPRRWRRSRSLVGPGD